MGMKLVLSFMDVSSDGKSWLVVIGAGLFRHLFYRPVLSPENDTTRRGLFLWAPMRGVLFIKTRVRLHTPINQRPCKPTTP